MDDFMVRLIQEQGLEATGRFYSIYTGIVEDNDDPLQMHRLKVSVPSVMGGITQWAFAKGSPGGFNCGAKLLTPDIGDLVYVEFEFGNPDKPLWTYNGWGEDEMPQELADPDVMGVVTPNGNIITVNDKTGDLSIHLNGNTSIQLDGDFIVQSKDSVCIGGEKGTAINKGEYGGVIIIQQLTDKLNKLQGELEKLRNLFNSHTHTSSSPGSPTSPNLQQATSPFSKFNKEDYEDKKFIH